MRDLETVLQDVIGFGAAAAPTETLLAILFPDTTTAERALLAACFRMPPAARTDALLSAREGPRLVAALELGRRALAWPPPRGVVVDGPDVVVQLVAPRFASDQETLAVLFLDRHQRLTGIDFHAGTRSAVEVAPAQIVAGVLRTGAARLVMAHHHPSGSSAPSAADLQATASVQTLVAPLGIRVIDHVILGRKTVVSLVARGQLPATRGYQALAPSLDVETSA